MRVVGVTGAHDMGQVARTALAQIAADPHVNALGIKGGGEIGITGSAGAVAYAVWHATAIRVRRFPIRIENLVATASR
jgi:CO/xanthine dehydrogenase Mo-binding subunit